MRPTRILPLLIIAALAPAYGAVYECQRGGETLYTNKPGSGCRAAAKLPPIGAYSSENRVYANRGGNPNTRRSNIVRSSRSGTAGERVSPQVQLQRDGGRLNILQRELDNEQKALAAATRNLAAGKAAKHDATRIASLEGAVKDRQENIAALQKEIGRM